MKRVVSIFLTLVIAVNLAIFAFAKSSTASVYSSYIIPSGTMRMIAHTGYSAVAPGNTLPAYEAAGKSDFWGAECDIQRTKDGIWILMHNDTVDDIGNCEKFYKLGVNAITTNSISQEKPEGNIFQQFLWSVRDFLYSLTLKFKALYGVNTSSPTNT